MTADPARGIVAPRRPVTPMLDLLAIGIAAACFAFVFVFLYVLERV